MVSHEFKKEGPQLEGAIRNVRDEAHVELKKANIVYTECVNKQFLPAWLKGESLQLNTDVCSAEYEDMMEKNSAIYGEFPLPFQSLKIPSAPTQ